MRVSLSLGTALALVGVASSAGDPVAVDSCMTPSFIKLQEEQFNALIAPNASVETLVGT